MSAITDPTAADPKTAAERLFDAHRGEQAWLDAFTEHLDRHRSGQELGRILSAWGLSQAETARLLGISRQAVGKWLARGAPTERAALIGDLGAATDLLVRYIKRERIPAVVRRPIAARSGRSLVDLLANGDSAEVLQCCRQMFAFERAQR